MNATLASDRAVIAATLVLTACCIIAALARRWVLSAFLGGLAVAIFWGYFLGGVIG